MMETWKNIDGHPGYQVSNIGRVKSLDRTIPVPPNKTRFAAGRVLKPCDDSHGYATVQLGRTTRRYVHRLVAEAFVHNTKQREQVNHIDGNPKNNRSDNLEWVTRTENLRHALHIGLTRKPNKTGYRGVRWHPTMKKFEARISAHRKCRIIGYFEDPKAAHQAYLAAEKDIILGVPPAA